MQITKFKNDVKENRKVQRDKVVQLRRRLTTQSQEPRSPPHLRSAGRVLDLPNVQPDVLEWQPNKGN